MKRFRPLTIVTALATYLTILLGGFTRGSGAGLGCGNNWPRCTETSFFPPWSDHLAVIEWSHRLVALIAGIVILATAVQAWRTMRHDKRVVTAATVAAVLLPIQAYLGALTVWHHLDPFISATHMGTASALFGAVVATTIFAYYPRQGDPSAAPEGQSRADEAGESPASVKDYASMLKPGIMGLLVAMGIAGMILAGGSQLTFQQVFWTLLGGAMAAGAGGVINQVIERDLDAQMARTSHRPVAAGRIAAADALAYALVLLAVSFTMLSFMVNVLAAVITMLAVVFYVFIYTIWLKPSTPQGVVIGGAAGAAPALVGWAAVTGGIGLPALLLGALVFLWTPPHFWALAIAKREEYGQAGYPMMPIVKGLGTTKRQMILYTLATLLVAGAFYAMGYLGTVYLVASTLLGLAFLGAILTVVVDHDARKAKGAFWVSIAYLFLLFVSMAVDKLAPALA